MAERLGADVKAVFALSALSAVGASISDSGAIGWLAACVVVPALIFCIARAPLRYSLMTLMFCAFVLENPTEVFAGGQYKSPLFKLGAAMFDHLNNLTGIRALFFSGSDIVIVTMAVVGIMREKSRSAVDRQGRVATPRPLVRAAQVALAGAGYAWLSGMVRGGEFSWSLWQLQRVVYVPILFLLAHLALRGPKDHAALAKVLLAAATIRAVLAVLIKRLVVPTEVDPTTGVPTLPYATTHSDSVLFSLAFALLILLIIERAGRGVVKVALFLLPILAWGMIANTRRMVWVQVALILVTLYALTPDNRFKRKIRKIALAASPIVVVYFMAGWNDQWSTVFKPVRIARSVIDAKSDNSSLWRELENFDLISTIKDSPILGYGYGRRFVEAVPLPAVDYSLEYFLPHNSLLGLCTFTGYIGFTAITLMWGAGVYFAMRGYHAAKLPTERAAAIFSVGAVLVYMVQCFGDLGLGTVTGVYLLAPALVVAGKLATATGGWAAKPVVAPSNAEQPPREPARPSPRWPGAAGQRAR